MSEAINNCDADVVVVLVLHTRAAHEDVQVFLIETLRTE